MNSAVVSHFVRTQATQALHVLVSTAVEAREVQIFLMELTGE